MLYNLEQLDLIDNLNFIIKYFDFYTDYCHEENLSIDGDLIGETLDNIYVIEDAIREENIDGVKLKEVYDAVVEIHENILSINDIELFNNVHIVFTSVASKTIKKLNDKLSLND